MFWRSLWAAVFLSASWPGATVCAARWRCSANGPAGHCGGALLRHRSTCFVVALAYTTVANILLMQAGVPLLAALLAWLLFREAVAPATWAAIAAVIFGVAVMVSESLTGTVSPVGDGLALLIAVVVLRRHRHHPALCACAHDAGDLPRRRSCGMLRRRLRPSPRRLAADMGLLFAFGAVNLGVALPSSPPASGSSRRPSPPCSARSRPILGPIWVWLIHGEVPSARHRDRRRGRVRGAACPYRRSNSAVRRRPARPGVTGMPARH